MWGSPAEVETRRRILVAVWAYAYEILHQTLTDDAEYDRVCGQIDLSIDTGNATMDKWFRENFDPHTGMWVHNHPDKAGLFRIYNLIRENKPMKPELTKEALDHLAKTITHNIDEHTKVSLDDGFRTHFGASSIGNECDRYSWYGFRWVGKENFKNADGTKDREGRMRRLWNRGHREEDRFIEWLTGLGFKVDQYAEDSLLFYHPESDSYQVGSPDEITQELLDVSGEKDHEQKAMLKGIKRKQLRFSALEGHYGGSTDGVLTFPPQYGDMPRMLAEFKTFGSKYWKDLLKDGVQLSNPKYYAQMVTYGKAFKLEYAFFMAVNKDTDEIYIEIIKLNEAYADQLTVKAERIITSRTPPPKLNENSAHYKCKMCGQRDRCHNGAPYEKNCRSCIFASPAENKQWKCDHFGIIPEDFIAKGCDHWREAK